MSTVNALTIVVPIYNAAEHLTRCIDSITSNTFRNFELLLINDGSTDNSLEILKE
ncbi:glycosyltransferase family 2 protein, partial [Enterococcus casseliflavus]|uniref:glycosyltransferase family 2 protein n=1 Tax=Enterococcus casseliflavus TaxID=37734 RepID=UPI002891B831